MVHVKIINHVSEVRYDLKMSGHLRWLVCVQKECQDKTQFIAFLGKNKSKKKLIFRLNSVGVASSFSSIPSTWLAVFLKGGSNLSVKLAEG